MNRSSEHPHGESKQPRTVLWLLLIVAGIVILQVGFRSSPLANTPGKHRGDLSLTADALPKQLAGWTGVGFDPAPPPESLPHAQYWWVHAWRYTQGFRLAMVTFDQLGLDHWHELTDCYEGSGWELKERTVQSVAEPDAAGSGVREWEYVVARFEKTGGERATLIFSTFYEDGSPAEALRIGIDHKWENELSLTERLRNRVEAPANSEQDGIRHSRALQCQVFMPYSGTLPPEVKQSVIELHVASREQFRKLWRQHSETQLVDTGPGNDVESMSGW